MFQIGDKVVHPIYGAGTIRAIEERQDRDERARYYVIPDTMEADRLLVPVEAASVIGLRRAISSDDAKQILKLIHSQAHALAPERLERVAYLKKIDWTDPYTVAQVWRDLSVEAKNGKVCAATEKVRKRARRLLLSELCLATGMSNQQCSLMIDECGDGSS
ncbi:MAG: CarD family transcriptional regulator [Armatimonadota bacterium]|nr:CarD family transcriptional regulator [Armatimonadota bacterium]